jgi:hypothetical protein
MRASSEEAQVVVFRDAAAAAAGMKAFVDTDSVGSLRWALSRLWFQVGSLAVSIGLEASRDPLIVVAVVGAASMALASTCVVVVVTNGILVESTDLGSAGTHLAGNDRMRLADSPLGPENPVDGLHNSRRILPDVDGQEADCRTPEADMASDTGRHTVPIECRSAAVGCLDTLARQDCCLSPVGPVSWELACLWVREPLVCLGRHQCETRNRDHPPGTLSPR